MELSIQWLLFNFLVLSLFFYKSKAASDSCPAGCTCEGTNLKCQNPPFPIYLPSGLIERIEISGNISRIPANAFVQPKETTLKYLRIYDSEVSMIDSNAFNKLQVVALYFDNIKLENLSSRVFFNLKCFGLAIMDSEIDVMPTSLFEGLTTDSVFFSSNEIITLQTDVFKSASVDTLIKLHDNKINTVQKNALRAIVPIEMLRNNIKSFFTQDSVELSDFSLNELQCSCGLVWMLEDDSPFKEFLKDNTCILPNETTTYLNKMDKSTLCKDVDVAHTPGIWEQTTTDSSQLGFYYCPAGCSCEGAYVKCKNPTFPIYLPFRYIEDMSISVNISRIPANAFVQPKETTLKYLRIYDSEVSMIDSNAFNKLRVDLFILDNIKIKNLSSKVFFNLRCSGLAIMNSEIDVMPTSLFEGLTTTRLLFLHRNKIITLQTDVFKSASIRTLIKLSENKINTVQKNAFPANIPLHIQENNIKSFFTQDSVELGDFSLNELQCSCGLVWMLEDDSPFKEFLKDNTCILPNETTTYLNKMDKSTLCIMQDVDITKT